MIYLNKNVDKLEELLAKSEIKFPQPVKEEEFENLLINLAINLDSDIDLKKEYNARIMHIDNIITEEKKYNVKYYCGIKSLKTFASASFYTESQLNNPDMITGIRFDSIPGYSLQEHRAEEVAVWDSVRKIVEDYFSKK